MRGFMKDKETKARNVLTRELVLRAAVELLDEAGVEAFSMRQLGARLGVEAMSLYNHAKNKEDILDGALDMVLGEISIPDGGSSWRQAMRERAISALAAFGKHPWAAPLNDSRVNDSPTRLRYFDSILGCLEDAGFSLREAVRAFSVLDAYVYGFARQLASMERQAGAGGGELASELLETMPAGRYPRLERMAEIAKAEGYDAEADFAFGLDLILDGIAARLAGKPSAGAT